jgi:hypothetical protein
MNKTCLLPRPFVCCFLALLQLGCKAVQTSPSAVPQSSATNSNYACALLYELLGDEKDVSKLLIIKRERAELNALIKEISDYTGKTHQQLQASAKSDPAINLKETGLPTAELQTRKAIAKTRAKELLTEHGKDFEVLLLLTQNEALTYGAHLAATAAAAETSTTRRQQLQQFSTALAELQKKVVAMLLANYNWPAAKQ